MTVSDSRATREGRALGALPHADRRLASDSGPRILIRPSSVRSSLDSTSVEMLVHPGIQPAALENPPGAWRTLVHPTRRRFRVMEAEANYSSSSGTLLLAVRLPRASWVSVSRWHTGASARHSHPSPYPSPCARYGQRGGYSCASLVRAVAHSSTVHDLGSRAAVTVRDRGL